MNCHLKHRALQTPQESKTGKWDDVAADAGPPRLVELNGRTVKGAEKQEHAFTDSLIESYFSSGLSGVGLLKLFSMEEEEEALGPSSNDPNLKINRWATDLAVRIRLHTFVRIIDADEEEGLLDSTLAAEGHVVMRTVDVGHKLRDPPPTGQNAKPGFTGLILGGALGKQKRHGRPSFSLNPTP